MGEDKPENKAAGEVVEISIVESKVFSFRVPELLILKSSHGYVLGQKEQIKAYVVGVVRFRLVGREQGGGWDGG